MGLSLGTERLWRKWRNLADRLASLTSPPRSYIPLSHPLVSDLVYEISPACRLTWQCSTFCDRTHLLPFRSVGDGFLAALRPAAPDGGTAEHGAPIKAAHVRGSDNAITASPSIDPCLQSLTYHARGEATDLATMSMPCLCGFPVAASAVRNVYELVGSAK